MENKKTKLCLLSTEFELNAWLSDCLSDDSYEISVASTLELVIDSDSGSLPDVIVIDFDSSWEKSIEVYNGLRIRKEVPHTPIVFLISRVDNGTLARLREANADDFILKTASKNEVRARLENCRHHCFRVTCGRMDSEVLSAAIDHVEDIVLVVQYDGKIVFSNRAAERFYEGEIKEKNVFDLRDDQGRSDLTRLIREVQETDNCVSERIHLGLSERLVSIIPLSSSGRDGLPYLVIVNHGIGKDDKLGIHLRQSQKMESVALLADGIAHDLNNILGGMIGYISLLKARAKPTDHSLPALEMIEKASDRASEVISQLLDFASNKVIDMKPLDLNTEIKKALNLIKGSIRRKIKIEKDFEKRLPSIWGDSLQIEQVVMNIAFAAMTTLPEGYGDLSIISKLVESSDIPINGTENVSDLEYVCMMISMKRSDVDSHRISDDYASGSLVNKKLDSAGLGLAIVRNIVNDYNGFFFTDNESQSFTVFRVYFPVYNPSYIEPQLEGVRVEVREENSKIGKILVIDDEMIILQMIRDSLELLGYNGLFASSGAHGIKTFREHMDEIVLVILDLYIPDMPGEEILKELRRCKPNLRVLVASGYEYRQKAEMMKELNVDDYLPKPFKINNLEEKLRRLL